MMGAQSVLRILFLCIAVPSVSAQMMVEAMLTGQVLTTTKQGKVNACGVRVVGIPQSTTGKTVRMFDGSLNLLENGYGIGKIVVSEGPLLPPDPSKMKPMKVLGVWLKAQGKTPAAPIKDLIPGETPMSVLFITDFEPTLNTINAMVFNEPIQIGIKTQTGLETIYFGRLTLTNPERDQFMVCLEELRK